MTSTLWDVDSLSDDRFNSSDDESTTIAGTKKRRRLTYLTPEEKLVRRKLKNRVAAQTARDRKKQRMTELEEMIVVLETKNKQLVSENDELRRSAQTLVDENKLLRKRLEAVPDDDDDGGDVVNRMLSDSVAESAVLETPLPRETERTSVQLAAAYCLACMIVWMMSYLDSSKNNSEKVSSLETSSHPITQTIEVTRSQRMNPLGLKWWGRHQQNWNPPMK